MKSSKNSTEARFWSVINQVNWFHTCKDKKPWEAGKETLMRLLPTKTEANDFREWYHEKEGQLYKALTDWEAQGQLANGKNPRNFCLGDDSFGDLISHIIGCGKSFYDAELAEPELAHRRALDYNFEESFSYCIPYDEDYNAPVKKVEKAEYQLRYWLDCQAQSSGTRMDSYQKDIDNSYTELVAAGREAQQEVLPLEYYVKELRNKVERDKLVEEMDQLREQMAKLEARFDELEEKL